MRTSTLRAVIALLLLALLAACGDTAPPRPPKRPAGAYNDFAEEFTTTLIRRDYARAHTMLSQDYAKQVSAAGLKAEFDELVSRSATGVVAEAVGEPLTEWPDQTAQQTAVVYVSIDGENIDESGEGTAISLTLAEEGGQQRVSDIEYGRAD